MDDSLAQTPLHAWHQQHGGRLVDFAGWEMPLQYTSISREHLATRQAASLFDVSHMGRFVFQGPSAATWLDSLLSRRVDDLEPGRIRYSLVTRDDGGILDDVLAYHLPGQKQPVYLLVVNASNRGKIWQWLVDHAPPADLQMTDQTETTAMIAVQGPAARQLVIEELGFSDLAKLRGYSVRCTTWEGHAVIYSRTGYTGEDGAELILPSVIAADVWQRLMEAGAERGVVAAGLGARDTLRLEAAMPLYGHELSETVNPLQAGLAFAVDLDHRSFPGRDVLASLESKSLPRRVGLLLDGKRVARQHAAVLSDDGRHVGEVTSGTYSPTLERSIAMAYVAPASSRVGQRLGVDVRGREEAAEVVSLPFYQRPV